MTRRRSAVAITLGLVALGATGIGTLATGGDDGNAAPTPAGAPTTTITTTTIRSSTTTVTTTTSTTTTTMAVDPAPVATTTAPPATVPTPTIAPIVTHNAEIDVLAPIAVAAPVRVVLPDLDVDGPVIRTGVNSAGELDVPPDARTLVWYEHGPTPGAPGSAVIAGHLNWRGVEGIFADLAETPVGTTFSVGYEDGTERAFVVRSVDLVDKPAVAVNGVFARDGESVLRLVTCGGEFDSSTRHYRSNVIVTAVPA
ncbi:MAG: class F sortase [Ilumatobacteraceae bacterium]